MELFWPTLSFILALKKLFGSSLGAANGSLRAHNHSTDSMDPNFGALEDLLEALLGLLRTSLRLSWSPLGVPGTSRASKIDAGSSFGQVFFDFELSTSQFELSK